MPNLVDVRYAQTGKSLSTNSMGMREMQARAFEARGSQYLLLKAPPASGKSRALMFLGLDKLFNQGIKKVIVAVPERSIGGSFDQTDLIKHGFFADWSFSPDYNLCTPGGDQSKVSAVTKFLNDPNEAICICTHATLRFAFDAVDTTAFNDVLLAIDEFHHVSADADNRLGEVLRAIMANTSAHVIAMTGSYFRGDALPVLSPEDEAKFSKVTYNYYEQLNGYTHLKSLGIGYHFYQGRYLSAIDEVLDTDKKTILHIPNVNAGESTKDKHKEVDSILDIIGEVTRVDPDTGVIFVKRKADGKTIKVADLVNDTPADRDKVVGYLRTMKDVDDIDLIIALGMAKEGFDWPYCEHALTVGYRGSLTEIIQIIGRATRDSDNKTHAQFTNLIAQPDAADDQVKLSVNNMLKAITASLLMEQVLAPNFKFKTKKFGDETEEAGTLKIRGFKEPSSQRVKDIVESDLNDLKAMILQDNKMLQVLPGEFIDPEVINKVMIPKVIMKKYPELNDAEIEELRQHVVVDSVIKNGEIKEVGGKKFVLMANKFVNIDDLNIDLIDRVNPFQKAFEILSKSVTAGLLKVIQQSIDAGRVAMTDEEAVLLYRDKMKPFLEQHGREPDMKSAEPLERRLAEAIVYLRNKRRQMVAEQAKTEAANEGGRMIDFEKELAEILASDPLGLLAYKPKVSSAITADERLVASFQEINAFVDAEGREPAKSREIGERRLFSRLEGVRADPEKASSLIEYDKHGLLAGVALPATVERESVEINSIDDIFADDVLGLLDPNSEEAIAADIFTLKHVSKPAAKPDHVAKRKPCKEFDTFEPLFKQANADLKSGVKKTVRFKGERQIRPETIFILQGMMVYVAGRGEWEKKGFGNFNARLYCVFDNGTESNMLLRSLAAAFWKDENSRQIVAHDQPDLFEEKLKVNADDEPTGYVYVLRSLSEDPKIQEIDNLFKIGFSTQPVKMRTQNAGQEPTYLMAEVQVAMECEVYNASPQKLEKLLHRFFANACLNLDVYGISSKRYAPREWFVVPLHAIEAAIEMLVNGEIVKYRYDHENEEIVPK